MKFPILIVSLLLSISINGQIHTTDDEIDKLALKLINVLNNKKKVKRVVVADFTYQGRANTRIGKYLADELSNGLMRNGGNFSVISREKARPELMAKAKQKDPKAFKDISSGAIDVLSKDDTETEYEKKRDKEGLIDRTAGFLGKMMNNKKILKRKDIIVFGTIEDKGDYLRVLIEMTKNDGKGEAVGGGVGNFIKTPEINSLLGGQVPVAMPTTTTQTTGSYGGSTTLTPKSTTNTTEIFKHKDLSFEVIDCVQNGRNIELKISILAENNDATLCLFQSGTRIIDMKDGHEFFVSEIKLADKSIEGYYKMACKTLLEGVPVEATLRFNEVKREVNAIARLEVVSQMNRKNFVAKLNNVPVN